MVPDDLEAGALRLRDLERFQVLAHAFREVGHVLGVGDPVGRVVGLLGGDGHHAVILDLDHLHLVEVELDDQPLDGPRIHVLTRAGPDPRQRPAEATLFSAVDFRVVATRPGVGDGHLEVAHSAPAQGRLPARVLADHLVYRHELFEHYRGLDALDLLPADDLFLGEGDDSLEGLAPGAVADDDERPPVDQGPIAWLPGEHVLFGRLVQHHVHKAVAGVEAALLLEDRGRRLDLIGRKWVERMPGRRDRWLYRLHVYLRTAVLPWKGQCSTCASTPGTAT